MSESAAVAPTQVIPQWSLGDRLRKIRRLIGMSQGELANKLETNAKTYAAWELDSTAPRNPVAVARRIEVISGVPAAWILGLDSSAPIAPGGSATNGCYFPAERHLVVVEPLVTSEETHDTPAHVVPNEPPARRVASVTPWVKPGRPSHVSIVA